MKVCMDGLRQNIVTSLARLTRKLNASIKQDDGEMISLRPEEIQQDMNELQSFVAGLCCIYEPGDDSFTDMSDFVYNNLPDFNPREDDE